MDPYYASWWVKPPSRCACGRIMGKEDVDEKTVHYRCPEHGVRVVGAKELKRGKVEEWHYYRLVFDESPDKKAAGMVTRLSLWNLE
jgi:hypothetical protein